ncbi:MAG TPA: response regulator [Stellaceae bacterium]|nr:response regulator [Stellaceae bacterium]
MDAQSHILIVDDEPAICDAVSDYLNGEGYRVSVAHDGKAMRQIIRLSPVDLVLLDVMLPGEDGLTIARSLRAEKLDIGIIMLTGRGDTVDRIIGLESGADDYLPKPFHMRELLARVRSVGRRAVRADAPPPNRSEARFAGWRLNFATRELTSPDGERVRLTGGEFGLLTTFVGHPNRVLNRDQLLELVSGRKAGPFDRTIDVQVGRLRRKLNDNPQEPQLIKTVRGGGYIFAAPIETVPSGIATAATALVRRAVGLIHAPAYCTNAPGAGQ